MFLASGLTVTEALACNTPLVIFDAIPGQEEENADFLVKNNMAVRLSSNDKSIRNTIEVLLTNDEKLKTMKKACIAFDKSKSCENIFEYFAAGNNRDGLAIKATCDALLEREEENKILIVLSDGKPNDVKIGNDRSRSLRGESSYKGMVGVKDTALEVRKARKQGILVLGVFTGKETDLPAEKIIYGKDFIYTKDIERFSDIVAMYLKKIIKN